MSVTGLGSLQTVFHICFKAFMLFPLACLLYKKKKEEKKRYEIHFDSQDIYFKHILLSCKTRQMD